MPPPVKLFGDAAGRTESELESRSFRPDGSNETQQKDPEGPSAGRPGEQALADQALLVRWFEGGSQEVGQPGSALRTGVGGLPGREEGKELPQGLEVPRRKGGSSEKACLFPVPLAGRTGDVESIPEKLEGSVAMEPAGVLAEAMGQRVGEAEGSAGQPQAPRPRVRRRLERSRRLERPELGISPRARRDAREVLVEIEGSPDRVEEQGRLVRLRSAPGELPALLGERQEQALEMGFRDQEVEVAGATIPGKRVPGKELGRPLERNSRDFEPLGLPGDGFEMAEDALARDQSASPGGEEGSDFGAGQEPGELAGRPPVRDPRAQGELACELDSRLGLRTGLVRGRLCEGSGEDPAQGRGPVACNRVRPCPVRHDPGTLTRTAARAKRVLRPRPILRIG